MLDGMANSANPDQIPHEGAVWYGSALFAYAILSKKLLSEILEQPHDLASIKLK